MHFTFQASIACVDSDRSRPSDGGGGGGGPPPPEERGGGGVQKKLFGPFGPQFGPKVRGEPAFPGPPPLGSATG